MNKGFIKLHRRTFNHKFWTKSRVFSEFEAWLDLLQQARFEETDTTEYVGDRSITYGRGQLPASRTFLAKRWGWGQNKVRAFLENLKKDRSITTDARQGVSVITICKYELYNSLMDEDNQSYNHTVNQDYIHSIRELSGEENRVTTSDATNTPPAPHHNIKKEKKEKKEECVRAKAAAFAPPTLAQVEEYCQERGMEIDCQRFVDFYQSKGWMVGRNKMKDWRAAVRTWRSSVRHPQANSGSRAKTNITNFRNRADYEQF